MSINSETLKNNRPNILQGGMGVAVSSWKLAKAVSERGEIGVISGTCIDTVMVRELQEGDPHDRRKAMRDYPDPDIVDEVIDRFYIDGGKDETEPYRLLPVHRYEPSVRSQRILSLAAFSEVKMAQSGHNGIIGINLMAELKRYSLACLYGAMLAGVSAVFIGAGIPIEEAKQIPILAEGEPAHLRLNVDASMREQAEAKRHYTLDPSDLLADPPALSPPSFFPIISSDSLARILNRKLSDEFISGWVIERHTAGGHNAPPRNKKYQQDGTPVYDQKDEANLERMRSLDKPFYLAGGYGTPENLQEAIKLGADGIQVGSIFSLADESGYPDEVTRKMITAAHQGQLSVRACGDISPTGFPFKVVELEDEQSAREKVEQRERRCDLGYLRSPFIDEQGRIRGRCPAEPVGDYLRKGGDEEETRGRACLCNALFANIGYPQQRQHGAEPRLLTGGDQLEELPLGSIESPSYTAEDVIDYLYAADSSP